MPGSWKASHSRPPGTALWTSVGRSRPYCAYKLWAFRASVARQNVRCWRKAEVPRLHEAGFLCLAMPLSQREHASVTRKRLAYGACSLRSWSAVSVNLTRRLTTAAKF